MPTVPARRHSSASVAALGDDSVVTTDTTSTSSLRPRPRLSFRRLSQVAVFAVTNVDIYFGSLTGTAQRLAQTLESEILSRGVAATLHDLKDFDAAVLANPDRLTPTRIVVFVVSTHFAGAPSPSAEKFHAWLQGLTETHEEVVAQRLSGGCMVAQWFQRLTRRRSHTEATVKLRVRASPLVGMQFAVLGVGDSMYLTFNAVGKFVDTKLSELGGSRVCSLGLGDVSSNLDASFLAWKADLLRRLPDNPQSVHIITVAPPSIENDHGVGAVSGELESPNNDPRGPSSEMKEATPSNQPLHRGNSMRTKSQRSSSVSKYHDNFGHPVRLKFRCRKLGLPVGVSYEATRSSDDDSEAAEAPPAFVEIVHATELTSSTASGASRVAIVRLRTCDPQALQYNAADALALFPHNSPVIVEAIARAFDYDLDEVVELYATTANTEVALPFRGACTIRTVLTEYLKLRLVSREFLRVAAGFVAMAETGEREKLEFYAATDHADDFRKIFQVPFKGILDVLELAPSLKIPLDVLVNIAPPIKPRFYTIASSPVVSSNEMELAISLGKPGKPQGLAASFFDRVVAAMACSSVAASGQRRYLLRAFVVPSQFRVPNDATGPMIMIVNGVGVAAARALMQERYSFPSTIQRARSKDMLFLGVANRDSIAFREEIQQWETQQYVEVFYAFSREPFSARVYIQQVVTEHLEASLVCLRESLLAKVFVCGSQAMVRQVRGIFAVQQLKDNATWFDELAASGRYVEEGFG